MPSRLLREGILDSAAVNELSYAAEVFYRRLMSVVDDFGRFDGRLAVLRSRLYPLRVDTVQTADISNWVTECCKAGLVSIYVVDDKPYILFHKLGPARAKDSKYPEPPEGIADTKIHPFTDENIRLQMKTSVPYSYSDSYSNSGSLILLPPFGEEEEEEEEEEKKEEEPSCPGNGVKTPGDAPTVAEVMEAWNEHASRCGWLLCKLMGTKRTKSVNARRGSAHWRKHWREALTIAAEIKWLRGSNLRKWVADIDWFLRPDTVVKLLEGRFADRTESPAGSKPTRAELFDQILKETSGEH